MNFVFLFQVGNKMGWMELEAVDWHGAFGLWLERRPASALLRVVSEREKFDWQLVGQNQDEVMMWVGIR